MLLTPNRFCSDPLFDSPWTWVYDRLDGLCVIAALAVAALIVLRRHMRHVAHQRANTPDGPDADFREPG